MVSRLVQQPWWEPFTSSCWNMFIQSYCGNSLEEHPSTCGGGLHKCPTLNQIKQWLLGQVPISDNTSLKFRFDHRSPCQRSEKELTYLLKYAKSRMNFSRLVSSQPESNPHHSYTPPPYLPTRHPNPKFTHLSANVANGWSHTRGSMWGRGSGENGRWGDKVQHWIIQTENTVEIVDKANIWY